MNEGEDILRDILDLNFDPTTGKRKPDIHPVKLDAETIAAFNDFAHAVHGVQAVFPDQLLVTTYDPDRYYEYQRIYYRPTFDSAVPFVPSYELSAMIVEGHTPTEVAVTQYGESPLNSESVSLHLYPPARSFRVTRTTDTNNLDDIIGANHNGTVDEVNLNGHYIKILCNSERAVPDEEIVFQKGGRQFSIQQVGDNHIQIDQHVPGQEWASRTRFAYRRNMANIHATYVDLPLLAHVLKAPPKADAKWKGTSLLRAMDISFSHVSLIK